MPGIEGIYILEGKHICYDNRGDIYATSLAVGRAPVSIVEQTLTISKLGTFRGLHWQEGNCPHEKLIRCVNGRIFDILYDRRPNSSTYGACEQLYLIADTPHAVWIPDGVAHGWLALTEGASLLYCLTTHHRQDATQGMRWNDPALSAVPWPMTIQHLSHQDRTWPDVEASTR